jgi:hypothetical protein
MTTNSDNVLAPLREALEVYLQPPVATGILSVAEQSLSLFFKTGESDGAQYVSFVPACNWIWANTYCRAINFATATTVQLETLSNACQAATFGRNNEDILDESYRKAGKLDRARFSVDLGDELPNLLTIVKDVLLDGENENKSVRAELYKLNVYGEHLERQLVFLPSWGISSQ